ncbi:hexokinase [Colletotrichum higginsianum]|uniref:Phosphotransferase n=1 Tax=Colletotrichum higginsianum (strain IMI 349063) TaxID=759273 RepID=H1VPZ8_COLHI|nr:Hexokinase [Colletotrichum higginsianum IMI 349063]OBR11448.1 Hexokinase [Colletotrichum higginsianum IMI 349063]CCF42304.1 hexokinase [Colletotrichum higginsianum]
MSVAEFDKDPASGLLAQARRIAHDFDFPAEDVRRATLHFLRQLNEGLQQDGTSLCQIPSFVTNLPNGSEKGVCMAIDLGGTNLRVCSVNLKGDSTYSLTQSKAVIPRHLMTAPTYRDLFRFIALQTKAFLAEHHPSDLEAWSRVLKEGSVTDEERQKHCKSLGFTFSFTFDQHAINKGTLLYWTKSFDIADAVGRDPCAMLQEALDEQHLPLLVTALANDTVGTLAARAYTSPGRSGNVVGAIFGTGTNGAYMERVSRITKLHSRKEFRNSGPGAVMALNTEWGGFDSKLEVLPTTKYDRELDRDSVNPDDQHFEKRVSGMYLGEILRRILLDLIHSRPGLLELEVSETSLIHVPDSIDSSLLSSVVKDETPDLEHARHEIARVLGAAHVSTGDARAIKILSEAIGRRSARLSSVAIAGVALQSGALGPRVVEQPLAPSWSLGINILTPILYGVQSLWKLLASWLHVKIRVTVPKGVSASSFGSLEGLRAAVSDGEGEVVDIGVDGSLIEHFPNFELHIREALRGIPELGGRGDEMIRIGMARDGSGVGAALIAWAARSQ